MSPKKKFKADDAVTARVWLSEKGRWHRSGSSHEVMPAIVITAADPTACRLLMSDGQVVAVAEELIQHAS